MTLDNSALLIPSRKTSQKLTTCRLGHTAPRDRVMLTAIRHKALLVLGCVLLVVMLAACGGETGPQGETGSSGPQGSVGEIGKTDFQGEQSSKGDT